MNILVNYWNARDLFTETYIRTELFSGQRLNSQLCDASQPRTFFFIVNI